jgi:hypothetical protein
MTATSLLLFWLIATFAICPFLMRARSRRLSARGTTPFTLGTPADNVADMFSKKRDRLHRGYLNNRRKLTREQARETERVPNLTRSSPQDLAYRENGLAR